MSEREPEPECVRGIGLSLRYAIPGDVLDPGFHCVRTRWIRGFIAFQLVRRIRIVMLMVPVI